MYPPALPQNSIDIFVQELVNNFIEVVVGRESSCSW